MESFKSESSSSSNVVSSSREICSPTELLRSENGNQGNISQISEQLVDSRSIKVLRE